MTLLPHTQTPLSRLSLADSVYETLVEAIVQGQLPAGTPVSSVALSEQLQVSRTPVTEAIQRLCYDGLIEQSNNRKARVVSLNQTDLREIYEMRMQLEGTAAERAATRLSTEQLKSLRSLVKKIKSAQKELNWAEQAIEFDLQFHDQIAQAVENRRLQQDIQRYRRLVRCFCRMTGNATNLKSAFQEHLKILEALEARKPAAARKAMVQHIQQRYEAVKQELSSHA